MLKPNNESDPSGSAGVPPPPPKGGQSPTDIPAKAAASSKPTAMTGVFSEMYDRLVDDSDDLPGLIAYGFYQLEKREWTRSHFTKYGSPPPDSEVTLFCDRYQESAIKSLKERADRVLFLFAEEYTNEQMTVLQGKAFNDRAALELSKVHDKINHMSTYRHHIVSHIVGFTCFLLAVWFVVHVIPLEPHIASFFGLEQPVKPPENK